MGGGGGGGGGGKKLKIINRRGGGGVGKYSTNKWRWDAQLEFRDSKYKFVKITRFQNISLSNK